MNENYARVIKEIEKLLTQGNEDDDDRPNPGDDSDDADDPNS